MTRAEKEAAYIARMTELQTRWGNPLDGDWDFVRQMADEQLDKSLQDTIGQLRFEKVWDIGALIVKVLVIGFVFVGLSGLLLFGWRQIFQ